MFPWWLRNDLHLLFINIVSFQGYRFSETTISGTLVAAFSLRPPPAFSPMFLSTIEGSHGRDNDSRWSFHERTHHVDRLHGDINILPWTEQFDTAKFISAEYFWQSWFFNSDTTDTVAVPLLDLDLKTFVSRVATTAVSTSLVTVYDVMADWWDERQNGVLELQNDEYHIWGLQNLFWKNVIWSISSLMHHISWHLDFC